MARTRRFARKTNGRKLRRHRARHRTRKGGVNAQTMWHTYQARKHADKSQELAGHIWFLGKEFGRSSRQAAMSVGQAVGSLL